MIPEKSGAPDASAIPKQRGTATKKTTIPAGISEPMFFKYVFIKNRVDLLNSLSVRIGSIKKLNLKMSLGLVHQEKMQA
jgi:hypothetical protein